MRRKIFLQKGLDKPFRKTRSDLPVRQFCWSNSSLRGAIATKQSTLVWRKAGLLRGACRLSSTGTPEQHDFRNECMNGHHSQAVPLPKSATFGSAELYSITSSARTSSVGGTVRPSALAVFMLITSSNLVGCSTGRSAGLVPLRLLST